MTMHLPPLPRAPWHAPASRRVGRVSPGLPTLIVCVLGLLPFTVQAGRSVATGEPMAAATIDTPPAPVSASATAPATGSVTDAVVASDAGDGDGRGGRGDRGGQGRGGGGGRR